MPILDEGPGSISTPEPWKCEICNGTIFLEQWMNSAGVLEIEVDLSKATKPNIDLRGYMLSLSCKQCGKIHG